MRRLGGPGMKTGECVARGHDARVTNGNQGSTAERTYDFEVLCQPALAVLSQHLQGMPMPR